MIRYIQICMKYGIKPTLFGRKKDLSIRERKARECKIDIINMCSQMMNGLDDLNNKIKNMPESDICEQLNDVKDLQVRVTAVRDYMEELLVEKR